MTDTISASPSRQSVLEGCTFGFKFFAKVLATRRRNVFPMAMPLIPPSGFESAVNLAPIEAFLMSTGILPCANLSQADINNSVVSVSSNKILRCSHVNCFGPLLGGWADVGGLGLLHGVCPNDLLRTDCATTRLCQPDLGNQV